MTNQPIIGFLRTGIKSECIGCGACAQVCAHGALKMSEDLEGFRYPVLVEELCVNCGLCNKVCPEENDISKYHLRQKAFGGYAKDEGVRCMSTSGGAFSCIVDTWCKDNYVIFGATGNGIDVYHSHITDKAEIKRFRKSKYIQSKINDTYKDVRIFLKEGKNVLFSGTPCQIAGLRKYLELYRVDTSSLLTVEVVCEGVPSPLYVKKLDESLLRHYGGTISNLDYRFKDGKFDYIGRPFSPTRKGRWDFEVMRILLSNGKKLKKDRWFNPFWSIWLQHLMNRPSCYACPYATQKRVADVTLGDLWGVHIYCPELYGGNGGSSVIIANTLKGREALRAASIGMVGHEIEMDDVIRFQGPLRRCIPMNPQREAFMKDLEDRDISIEEINKKWANRPSLKLILSKYIWGNHQKVRLWNLKHKFSGK
ncbi:MAG: Coenzyme F420 hydrogenase/dehydrogenase, beta subunit C-terminal domain [Muribaculaceae bacterium]|nr:Coenzyme F420 hydrogenase/dehydrogenase, beta subunit C-terminal domain [Muribaculaceae bacterium]